MKMITYYLMMILGFVFMLILMLKRREMYSLKAWQAVIFTLFIMFSGLLGCKILYILENLGQPITFGGFSFFGAVFLVPPLMALFGLIFKLKPIKSIEASAACVCAMVGTIRIGCFLNGCCGGWTAKIGETVFVWPTQLIECVFDFLILAYLLRAEKKGKSCLYARFMLHYSEIRFLLEFLRDTDKDWLWLSHGQWFAIIAIIISLIVLYINYKKSETNEKRRTVK